MRNNFDATVTWRDLEMIRSEWGGTLIVKGILDVEDAVAAADLGSDGIVVSNHGGRQLDGVPSTAHALPYIADKVGDRLTVLADGGIRSGRQASLLSIRATCFECDQCCVSRGADRCTTQRSGCRRLGVTLRVTPWRIDA